MSEHPVRDKLINAYHVMLDDIKNFWNDSEPRLREALDKAAEKASDLGELSREEADRLTDYIQKDLEQAANFIEDNGKQLRDWLKFDLEFAESRFAELFADLADRTRLELAQLAERARQVGEWHTGEITHVGVLYCKQCAEALYFEKPGHIPPCPRCRGTVFKKVYEQKTGD